jgi:hypothetical protein
LPTASVDIYIYIYIEFQFIYIIKIFSTLKKVKYSCLSQLVARL